MKDKAPMERRIRLFIAALILVMGSIFVVILVNMYWLALSDQGMVFDVTFWDTLLFFPKDKMLLFYNFEVVVLLLSIYYYIINRKPYQADLVKITDYIYTPKKAGQNQHGSAQWLKPTGFNDVFASFTIDRNDPIIKRLMELGNVWSKNDFSKDYILSQCVLLN